MGMGRVNGGRAEKNRIEKGKAESGQFPGFIAYFVLVRNIFVIVTMDRIHFDWIFST